MIRPVAFYIFELSSGELKLERDEWWNGMTEPDPDNPGHEFIVTADHSFGEPSFEILKCGHRKPVEIIKRGPHRGRKGYRLRRFCRECAARRSIAKMRLENIRRLAA